MRSDGDDSDVDLTVGVTVVSGKECLRRCLAVLQPQVESVRGEIIVPYDEWSAEVGELSDEYPHVRFHRIGDEGLPISRGLPCHEHRLYDRRRAASLSLARGRIVAMTEDHAVPARDWCARVLEAHEQPFAAIGGAIQNGVDRPLNWALYYCDFGRYGLPLSPRESKYASDVNISYKRTALASICDVWKDSYHETAVHEALRARGETVFLDPRPVVYQCRPAIRFRRAFVERLQWGRVFAETRVMSRPVWLRGAYAFGTPLLPWLLAARVLRHMRRQEQPSGRILMVLPVTIALLVGWTLGECIGYIVGPPRRHAPPLPAVRANPR